MRSALFSILTALAVTACTGETDYDVLEDYNEASSDPTVASDASTRATADAGSRATPSRGTDAGTVAQRPDASAPPPDPTPPPPPAKKKKGKGHDD